MSLLLHFTDTHLYGNPTRMLKGVNTHASCAAVLTKARQAMPEVDVVILGGDISQDGSAASYEQMGDLLKRWRKAAFMLSPGNHADMEMLKRVLIPSLQRISCFHDHLRLDHWLIITLNTHVPGREYGILPAQELRRLDALLAENRDRHALLAMHHPPISIGSSWIDTIGLHNAEALWRIVDRHPHVRCVLCGHVHQAFDGMRGKVRVLATPSTCIQFKPDCDTFQLDDLSPGYRWLRLHPDGDIDTGVERVDGFIPPDLNDNSPY